MCRGSLCVLATLAAFGVGLNGAAQTPAEEELYFLMALRRNS